MEGVIVGRGAKPKRIEVQLPDQKKLISVKKENVMTEEVSLPVV